MRRLVERGRGRAEFFAVERVWTDERQFFGVAYLTLERSAKDDMVAGPARPRELSPAHETIAVRA